jgi:hypothetical protein
VDSGSGIAAHDIISYTDGVDDSGSGIATHDIVFYSDGGHPKLGRC